MSDAPSLLVADSFRVRADPASGAAQVRGFGLHLERFRSGVAEMREHAPDDEWWELVFEPFMQSVPEQVARGGAGFPRLELMENGDANEWRLDVRIRPLPKLGARLEVRSATGVDLVTPNVKGPNIAALTELNRRLGAEALLLDGNGTVVEGATTSLLWWRGSTLCAARSRSRVKSVTETLVLSSAQLDSAGFEAITVEHCDVAPQALVEHEVWAVNALHGIRVVTDVDGTPTRSPEPRRLARFRDALEEYWEPVLGECEECEEADESWEHAC